METKQLKNPTRLYNVNHPQPGVPIKDKDTIAFFVPPQGGYVEVEDRVARRIVGTHMNQRRVPYFSLQAPNSKEVSAPDNRDAIIELQAQELAAIKARLAELEKANNEEKPQEIIEDNLVDAGEYFEEEDFQPEEEAVPEEVEVASKRGRKNK